MGRDASLALHRPRGLEHAAVALRVGPLRRRLQLPAQAGRARGHGAALLLHQGTASAPDGARRRADAAAADLARNSLHLWDPASALARSCPPYWMPSRAP